MLESLLRWWWEFFHSFLGDSAFAKFLAAALALIATPIAFFALLSGVLAMFYVVALATKLLSPLAGKLLMRVAYYLRAHFKR